MNEVRNDELVELSLRRELTPEEMSRLEAHFAAHPEARGKWEDERVLSRALQSLPDVPVSSNFTALVLQALDVEKKRDARRAPFHGGDWLRRFLPRLGWAAAAVLIASLVIQGVRTARHAEFAKDVSFAAGGLAKVPNPEILLQDFDAIHELGQVSTLSTSSDDELLRVLQ